MGDITVRLYEATDERQYMINDAYEVYEKVGTPTGAMNYHCHNFYELIYILEGEYASEIETKVYHMKKGDFLLVDQNIMHKCYLQEGKENASKRIILWVTDGMLQKLSDGQGDLTECFKKNEVSAYHFPIFYEEMLRGYLMRLVMTSLPDVKRDDLKMIMDRGYLTLFFSYLNALIAREEYDAPMEESRTDSMVKVVNEYIEKHLQEQINVDDLAGEVHMSKYHFLRKFKEQTGITAHHFIIHKRLVVAGILLKEGKGIQEVSQLVGFQDYTSFLRNFKQVYGVSPGQFKQIN